MTYSVAKQACSINSHSPCLQPHLFELSSNFMLKTVEQKKTVNITKFTLDSGLTAITIVMFTAFEQEQN